jgi:Lar family restriction alleviation protein
MNEILKPCPFCGGDAQYDELLREDIMIYWVECSECTDTNIDVSSTKEIAAEKWNTRPIEDELNARIAELEKSAIVWHRFDADDRSTWPTLRGTYLVNTVFGRYFGIEWNPIRGQWILMGSDGMAMFNPHEVAYYTIISSPRNRIEKEGDK